MKKLFSLLLALLCSAMSFAETYSGTCGTNLQWSLNTDVTPRTLIFSGTGAMTDFPDKNSVPWYQYRSQVDAVLLPEGLTSIGSCALLDCDGISSVSIPGSVRAIGQNAFCGCLGLMSMTVPSSVTTISADAFRLVNNIVYSGSATGTPWGAKSVNGFVDGDLIFADESETVLRGSRHSLTEVVIPATVTTIGDNAFSWNHRLASVTIPNTVTSIGDFAFAWCYNLASIDIPASVTSIGSSAFGNTGLSSVSIPGSVATIGGKAFEYCTHLSSVYIPNSVTSIGSYAFLGCVSLTSITIPNSVTVIEGGLFHECTNLQSVVIGDAVTTIREWVFSGCRRLASFTIPNTVTSIGERAFYQCISIPSIVIPNSVTTMGNEVFHQCISLTSVSISNSLTSIGKRTFRKTGLTSVIIPESVTSIGEEAFFDCNALTSVTIPASVSSIGAEAFGGCLSLMSMSVPNSVSTIGNNAFRLVNNIVYSGSATGTPWGAKSVNGYIDGDLIFSDESKTHLLGCRHTATDVVIPGSVISIGDFAFAWCYNLTSIDIPASVTSIGSSAFGNTGLSSVSIPGSVATIGGKAFEYCTHLSSVYIPNSVTSIGSYAFLRCVSLTSITIPKSLTAVEQGLFCSCRSLTSVSVPKNVSSIGVLAFSGCTGLQSIVLRSIVPPSVDDNSFNEVSGSILVSVPCGAAGVYRQAAGWSGFTNYSEVCSTELVDNRTPLFSNEEEELYPDGITYQRNFTYTGRWCPLYIPINVAVDADFLEDFDVAKIFAYARLYDTNGDGTLDAEDAPYLVVEKLVYGQKIQANHPYVIRPKTVGEKTLVSSDNILYPAEEDSIACSTTETRYVFRGNYSTKTIVNGDGNYFITTRGTIGGTASTTTLYAYRWYMNKYDSREGYGPDDDPAAVEARIVAIGEEVDEATALEAIEAADAQYSRTSAQKILRDGHLYILRGEHIYDSTGRLIE